MGPRDDLWQLPSEAEVEAALPCTQLMLALLDAAADCLVRASG